MSLTVYIWVLSQQEPRDAQSTGSHNTVLIASSVNRNYMLPATETIQGDAARDYINDSGAMILQINNCTSCKLHRGSFSHDLATVFPYSDPYRDRVCTHHYQNLAIIEDRPQPGSIQFKTAAVAAPPRPVICCLFAQYRMGGNGRNYYYQKATYVDAEYLSVEDCPRSRLNYFQQSMVALADLLISDTEWKNINKIIIPFYLGCGLGGGNWFDYRKIIDDFALAVATPKRKVILVKKKKCEGSISE